MNKRKKIDIKVIFIMLIFSPILAKSQEIGKDNEDIVVKNIISYHIRYAQPFELNLLNNGVLEDRYPFFERMWPSDDNNLEIEVENVDIDYPNNKYRFYHIIKPGFNFSKNGITKAYTNISLSFDRDYFVGITSDNKDIKFLSGNFFLSPIASDFTLNLNNPESFFNFLKIRYLNLGVVKLKYHKTKDGNLIFFAYSTIANEEVILTVDEGRFDNTRWGFKNKLKHIE